MTFFNKHNILFLYQYGFRKFHSTIFALIEITEKNKKNTRRRNLCNRDIFGPYKSF